MSQQDSPQTEQAAHSSGRPSPLAAIDWEIETTGSARLPKDFIFRATISCGAEGPKNSAALAGTGEQSIVVQQQCAENAAYNRYSPIGPCLQ
jgi:hypothetical protein